MQQDPPHRKREGGRKGAGLQRDHGDPLGAEQGVEPNSPPPGRKDPGEQPSGPASCFSVDEKRQEGGEVSEHGSGFISDGRGWT